MTKRETRGAAGREIIANAPVHTGRARGASNGAGEFVRAGKGEAQCDTDCGPEFDKISPRDRGAFPPPKIQHRPDGSKAYCTQKMVLTMGSTLDDPATQ
jgi:hypothetical protein